METYGSNKAGWWIIGAMFVFGLVFLAFAYQDEKTTLATLSPDEKVLFEEFRGKMQKLQKGDLITMKTAHGSALFMVERGTLHYPDNSVLLREGPPQHGNPQTYGFEDFDLTFRSLFAAFKQGTDICRKGDEGWEQLTTHYFLQ